MSIGRCCICSALLILLAWTGPELANAQSLTPVPWDKTMHMAAIVPISPVPNCLQAAGGLLYCAGGGVFSVLDIADPLHPATVGALSGLGETSAMLVIGERAWLSQGAAGLLCLDISRESAPAVAGTLALPAAPVAMAALPGYIAVAAGDTLYIVATMADGAMSVAARTYATSAAGLAITNGHAFVTGAAGIAIIDVHDPLAPQRESLYSPRHFYLPEPPFTDIVAQGNLIAVRSEQDRGIECSYGSEGDTFEDPARVAGINILGVTDPAAIRDVGWRELPVSSMTLQDGLLVVTAHASSGSVWNLLTLNLADASIQGSLKLDFEPGCLALSDNWLFAAYAGTGLAVFDLTTPRTIMPAITFGAPSTVCHRIYRYAVSGRYSESIEEYTGYGWVSCLDMRLFDLLDPLHPKVVLTGSICGDEYTVGFAIRDGGDVLLCGTHAGVTYWAAYDMRRSPPVSAQICVGGECRISGTTAWGLYQGTLTAIDCSQLPGHPVLSTTSLDDGALVLGRGGKSCMIRTSYNGGPSTIQPFDSADPAAPVIGTSMGLSGRASSWSIDGELLYLLAENTALQIIDMSDVHDPRVIGTLPMSNMQSFQLCGDLAVLSGTDTFQIASVADPAAPRMLSPVISAPGRYDHVQRSGNLLYVGRYSSGIDLYDIADPSAPVLKGNAPGKVDGVYAGTRCLVTGGAIYPLDATDPLRVLDPPGDRHDDTPKPALALDAYPNPFNPRTTIRYSTTHAGQVKVAIYDQRGRLVRTLVDAAQVVGQRSVEWDGLDRHGRAAPSGTYLVRLSTGQGTRTGKLTLAR